MNLYVLNVIPQHYIAVFVQVYKHSYTQCPLNNELSFLLVLILYFPPVA